MTYVLIALFTLIHSGTGMTTQEFNSREACEAAKAFVLSSRGSIRAVDCLPKGTAR